MIKPMTKPMIKSTIKSRIKSTIKPTIKPMIKPTMIKPTMVKPTMIKVMIPIDQLLRTYLAYRSINKSRTLIEQINQRLEQAMITCIYTSVLLIVKLQYLVISPAIFGQQALYVLGEEHVPEQELVLGEALLREHQRDRPGHLEGHHQPLHAS